MKTNKSKQTDEPININKKNYNTLNSNTSIKP